jgi:hypothetical protein
MMTGKPTFTAIVARLLIFPLPGRMLNPLFTKFPMLVTSRFQLMSKRSSFILVPKSSERLELLGFLVTMRNMAPGKMGFSSFPIDFLLLFNSLFSLRYDSESQIGCSSIMKFMIYTSLIKWD